MATVIDVTPEPQQVLYWWNAMRTYLPALISFTFQIGYLYWASNKLNTKGKIVAASLLSFLISLFSGGFNETFTVVQVIFFAGLFVLGILTRKLYFTDSFSAFLGAATLASSLSLAIMLTSPGTANRQGYFTASPDLITIFDITVKGYGIYLATILTSVHKISALISLVFVSTWIGAEAEVKQVNGWTILFVLCGGMLLAFASLLPSAYAFSEMPAPRTFIVPSFILVASFLIAGVLLGRNTNSIVSAYGKSSLMLIVVLSILFSTWVNARELYKERNIYISFAQRWDQIDAQIRQAQSNGAESVVIQTSKNWAGLDEPNDNPKYWVTKCYSLYYNFQVFGSTSGARQP